MFPPDRLGRQPIFNDGRTAAMRYMRLIPTIVECGPANNIRQHAFAVRANINLAWVPEDDIPCCLNVKGGGGCCGESKTGNVIYASEADIRQWTNGGGR